FRNDQTDPSPLGSMVEQWVSVYEIAKEKYKGKTRESVLGYLFWYVRGIFYYTEFEPSIEAILADYYKLSENVVYKEAVKRAELKFRERYNRRSAAGFTLTDINGQSFSKEQMKNKVAVLDFWFTGCTGCVQMAPALRKV